VSLAPAKFTFIDDLATLMILFQAIILGPRLCATGFHWICLFGNLAIFVDQYMKDQL
jgi:hypothetical protein